jgi:zinc protease
LTAKRDQPGLWAYADGTFVRGALGKHSQDDLRRILAGKTVGINFSTGPDAFLFTSGATTPDSLLVELQLLAASITDPGFRPEAGRFAAQYLEAAYNQLERTPQGALSLEVPTLLANGDTRFGLPPRAVEMTRTLDEEKAWLVPQFANGPIEISIDYAEERKVQFPAQVFSKEYTIKSEIPKALVALYWPTTDARDVSRARRLQMLTRVFDDRLRIKIREQLGDAYYVSTLDSQDETFPGYGRIEVMTTVAPDRTKDVTSAILGVAADLHANGVTAEEFERAKKPTLTALRDSARTNPYWLRQVLASCQEFPQHLDWARTRLSDVESITVDDLNALAKTYLAPERAFRVKVAPEDTPLRKSEP